MDTIEFESAGTLCGAWYLQAEHDGLANTRGRPCIVMAHGFGATKDSGLLPFATRFAALGCDVLIFDYRGFGTSGGASRQDIDHRRHRQDFHAAIKVARARAGVDPERIVLWGSSYSGGHVVVVAAQDRRIAAVISQGAAMDGLKALVMAWRYKPAAILALTLAGLRDVARAITGGTPHMIPIVGLPGTDAAITAPGALVGYKTIMGPRFQNEMRARGMLWIGMNRPVGFAARLACPILLIIPEKDNIVPVSSMHDVARLASKSEVQSFPCSHFDIYTGEVFEQSMAVQLRFLEQNLAVSAG